VICGFVFFASQSWSRLTFLLLEFDVANSFRRTCLPNSSRDGSNSWVSTHEQCSKPMKLWGFIAPHLLRDDHYPKLRGSLRPKVLTHSQLWLFDFSMSVHSKICQRRSADFWGFMSGRFLNDVRRYIQHWSKYNHTGIDMEKSKRKQWNLIFWTSFHIHPYSIPEWLPKWPKFSELPQKHLWHRVTLAYGLFKFLHLEFHSGNSHSLNKKAGTHYPQMVGLLWFIGCQNTLHMTIHHPDIWLVNSPWYPYTHRIHGAGIYANMTGVYWWDPCYHI